MDAYDLLNRNRELFIKMRESAIEQQRFIADDQIEKFFKHTLKRERIQREISHNNKKLNKNFLNKQVETKRDEKSRISSEIAGRISICGIRPPTQESFV